MRFVSSDNFVNDVKELNKLYCIKKEKHKRRYQRLMLENKYPQTIFSLDCESQSICDRLIFYILLLFLFLIPFLLIIKELSPFFVYFLANVVFLLPAILTEEYFEWSN